MGLFNQKADEIGRLGIFVIYDIKGQMFMTPFFQSNNASAIRSFSDLVNNPQSLIAMHPEDYSLFRIGNYDDMKGVISPEVPVNLGFAANYVKQPSGPVVDLQTLRDGLKKS